MEIYLLAAGIPFEIDLSNFSLIPAFLFASTFFSSKCWCAGYNLLEVKANYEDTLQVGCGLPRIGLWVHCLHIKWWVGTKFKHLCLILNTHIPTTCLLLPKCLGQILHKRISPQQVPTPPKTTSSFYIILFDDARSNLSFSCLFWYWKDILLLTPLRLLLRTSASLVQRRKGTEVSLKDGTHTWLSYMYNKSFCNKDCFVNVHAGRNLLKRRSFWQINTITSLTNLVFLFYLLPSI